MIQDTNRFLILLILSGLAGLAISLSWAVKIRNTHMVSRLLPGALFCLSLRAIDVGLVKFLPGYYAGTILYGCVFTFILYGRNWLYRPVEQFNENIIEPEIAPELAEKTPLTRPALTIDQSLKYKQLIKDHFTSNMAFRKPGYTIRDLANETGIPVYLVSLFINQEYGMNFNELVNAYRVQYLAKVFKTSVDWNSYTLEALGKMAGFNSRTAFIAAIKKHTGMTPSAFFGRKESEAVEHSIFQSTVLARDVA